MRPRLKAQNLLKYGKYGILVIYFVTSIRLSFCYSKTVDFDMFIFIQMIRISLGDRERNSFGFEGFCSRK